MRYKLALLAICCVLSFIAGREHDHIIREPFAVETRVCTVIQAMQVTHKHQLETWAAAVPKSALTPVKGRS